MKIKIAAALALCVSVCSVARGASADPPKKSNDVEYKFSDDDLLGKEMRDRPPMITVRKEGPRGLLHRVRTQFVVEMLKSVENM